MTTDDAAPRSDSTGEPNGPSLELLLKNLPGVVYRCRVDSNWTLLYASDAIEGLTGYSARELQHNRRLSFGDLIHAEDRPGIRQAVNDAIEAGRPFSVSYRITTADGEEKWILEHGCAVRDDAGTVVTLEGYLSDVTESRHAQQRITLLDFALDHTRDALFLIDELARIVDVNRPACESLGYERDELLRLSVADLNPDFSPELWNRHWQELRTGRTLTLETTHRRRDGTLIAVEISANHFEYRGREYNLALANDITRRRRARSLQTLQSRVLEMIASGTPLSAVLDEVARGMEAQADDALAAIQLLDADGLHLRPGAAPSLPDSFTRLADGMPIGSQHGSCGTAAWRREAVFVRDIDTDPLWIMGRDAARAHGLRACWSTPVIGVDGNVLATVALYHPEPGDPTPDHLELIERMIHLTRVALEHDRKERALQASEERLRYAVQAMADVIWDWNLLTDSVRRDMRAATAFGYDAAEVTADSGPWVERVHPDDSEAVRDALRTLRAGTAERDYITCDYRFRRKDGSWAHVTDSCTLIRDARGQVVRAIGGMRDISDRVALEEQLRQSQRMEAVGQLTGGIAHDFNNLLTVILGNAELLRERADDDPGQESLAAMIADAAGRGAELTARLLAFSRRQPLLPRSVAVGELIDGMRDLLHRTLGDHIEVVQEIDQALWPALADPAQLESSVLNLCINARDAMAGGGRLVLAAANARIDEATGQQLDGLAAGDYVTVTVTDQGSGITAEHLSRVFEPFFTTKSTGTGLGLSMVFGFAKQSRGHVEIRSRPGTGTTVRLYLPRSDKASAELSAPPRAPAAPPGLAGGETVMLVEDEPLVRAYARQRLERLGYSVIAAENGAQALEMLAQQPDVDLLFTDVMMPGMTGPQLVEAARAIGCRPRVLYTSGYAESDAVDRSRLTGNAPLLGKPYRAAELAARVRLALDS